LGDLKQGLIEDFSKSRREIESKLSIETLILQINEEIRSSLGSLNLFKDKAKA